MPNFSSLKMNLRDNYNINNLYIKLRNELYRKNNLIADNEKYSVNTFVNNSINNNVNTFVNNHMNNDTNTNINNMLYGGTTEQELKDIATSINAMRLIYDKIEVIRDKTEQYLNNINRDFIEKNDLLAKITDPYKKGQIVDIAIQDVQGKLHVKLENITKAKSILQKIKAKYEEKFEEEVNQSEKMIMAARQQNLEQLGHSNDTVIGCYATCWSYLIDSTTEHIRNDLFKIPSKYTDIKPPELKAIVKKIDEYYPDTKYNFYIRELLRRTLVELYSKFVLIRDGKEQVVYPIQQLNGNGDLKITSLNSIQLHDYKFSDVMKNITNQVPLYILVAQTPEQEGDGHVNFTFYDQEMIRLSNSTEIWHVYQITQSHALYSPNGENALCFVRCILYYLRGFPHKNAFIGQMIEYAKQHSKNRYVFNNTLINDAVNIVKKLKDTYRIDIGLYSCNSRYDSVAMLKGIKEEKIFIKHDGSIILNTYNLSEVLANSPNRIILIGGHYYVLDSNDISTRDKWYNEYMEHNIVHEATINYNIYDKNEI